MVYDGDRKEGHNNLLMKLTGSEKSYPEMLQSPVVSTTNKIFLTFMSDHTESHDGFEVQFDMGKMALSITCD